MKKDYSVIIIDYSVEKQILLNHCEISYRCRSKYLYFYVIEYE